MSMTNIEILKKTALFEGLNDPELYQLAECAREKDVIAGENVFDEGSTANALYILKSGTVEIFKAGEHGEQMIATIMPGSHFGEMGFLDGHHERSAGAMAKENALLLEIPFDGLQKVIEHNCAVGMAFYKNIALSLSRRIRNTTTSLSHLKDLKLRHV